MPQINTALVEEFMDANINNELNKLLLCNLLCKIEYINMYFTAGNYEFPCTWELTD